ncbi:unnamed protein product [Urochloa decumbens]|uniref:Uncharacterized protein n=1 Tax=Urochloa decumbens TaxID=240449 RepID=A0ABC9CX20_9POAL
MIAVTGKTDPVTGRDGEIDRVVCILCRRIKNKAVLLAAPGVGKTAVAEGLAQRIAGGRGTTMPASLAGARVVEVDLAALVAGTTLRGMLEERASRRSGAATTNTTTPGHLPIHSALRPFIPELKHTTTTTTFTTSKPTSTTREEAASPDAYLQDGNSGREDRRRAQGVLANKKKKAIVCPEHVAQVVSRWTGIPVHRIDQKEKDKLIHLADNLHKRVVGQDEAVNLVAQAVLRTRAGLDKSGQPIGCFLFLGSTGVGKTELAKALAEQLFGNERMLIRLDMSEFVGAGSVLRLIGAPPSYIGYEDGGQLTEKVRRRPYSVILFDEVEKADPSVFIAILQLLDDGVEGMAGKETMEAARGLVMKQVHKHFKPEFLNRTSDVVTFEPLSLDKLKEVVKIQIKNIIATVADKGIFLSVSNAGLDAIFSESYCPMYGARPIRRWVQKNVMTKLSEMLINGEIDEGSTIFIDATEDKKALKYEASKMTVKKLQDEQHVLEIATDFDDDVAELAPTVLHLVSGHIGY